MRNRPPTVESEEEPLDPSAAQAKTAEPATDDADSGQRRGRGGRSARITKDLTVGSVPGNLWFLAWPQIIEGVLNVSDQLADYFWAGRYVGLVAVAGLGAAQSYMMLLMTIRQGLDIAMKAMVSRAYGMGNVAMANQVVLQALTLTVIFVFGVALLGVMFTSTLLQLIGVSESVIDVTTVYMQIHFLGFGLVGIRMVAGAALQASGDVITPMKATTLTRILSLTAAPILMFGGIPFTNISFFPGMGIPGLALSAALGNLAGIAVNCYALFTGTSRLKLTLRGYRPNLPIIIQLIKIGWPAALTTAERSISQLILFRFVTPFGDAATAAYSLTRRLTQLTNIGAMGVGRASGILVGQNLGAGNEKRARQTVAWGVLMVAVIKGCIVSLIVAFPLTVAGIFTSDAELLAVSENWIRIMMIAALGQGIALVFRQSYEVAGDTLAPLIVTFVAMWGVEIPLAYMLSHHTSLDHYGVAVAISMAMVVMLTLFVLYYFQGRWLRIGFKSFATAGERGYRKH